MGKYSQKGACTSPFANLEQNNVKNVNAAETVIKTIRILSGRSRSVYLLGRYQIQYNKIPIKSLFGGYKSPWSKSLLIFNIKCMEKYRLEMKYVNARCVSICNANDTFIHLHENIDRCAFNVMLLQIFYTWEYQKLRIPIYSVWII